MTKDSPLTCTFVNIRRLFMKSIESDMEWGKTLFFFKRVVCLIRYSWDTWGWRRSPEMLWEQHSWEAMPLSSGVTVTAVLLTPMFSVSPACVRCRAPWIQYWFLPGFREGGDGEVRSVEVTCIWLLILTHPVTFDALPWTLVYPFGEWVSDGAFIWPWCV